ncbi:MAG: bifunctional methylenetetrahydrofolate dehydrogenase/methenyltetrahydrofolate cyclohydrolase FolD [Sedimentisphaerales bacterium]|nr:bifunctional methylenetetrahydrofolate dehydrogenase/methenyltetrahydrofolate cyclohydrolase FolD [Sedimentisphaerales bacterium]
MTAQIIDGKQVAADMRAELKAEVAELKKKEIVPGLAVVLVGEDPASKSYVTAKERACEELGIYSDDNRLAADTSQKDLMALIKKLNKDPKINGILVQLPLPDGLNEAEVLLAIDPAKDVDGFHPVNVGKMVVGEKAFLPCTPHGVIQLLIRNGVKLEGAEVVIVGRSNIVGKPLANMLIQKNATGNATVTVCHTRTRNLAGHTRRADIVIAAAGRPDTVTADMVKDGVVVIDVGVNRVGEKPSKKDPNRMVAILKGDVDFEAVKEKASLITPVPGGVGPMTITMLLYNTVESAKRAAGIDEN